MQRPSSSALNEVLRCLPDEWETAGFKDPLMGRDGSGRYLAARSGRGHGASEMFLVELNRHTPARGLALFARNDSRQEELQMRWNLTPEQALDAQSRDIVQRVLREFAAFKMHHAALSISLEIGERGAIIHAPYQGDESRNDFIAAARVLRRDLLHCLYRRGSSVERSAAVQPVAQEPQSRPSKPEPEVDSDVERALDNLEAQPMVTMRDLLAEKPAPATRKGWKRVGSREVFTVPEPEDVVEVLSAQASSTSRKRLKEDDQEKTKVITFLP
jgi:hypothetical protein